MNRIEMLEEARKRYPVGTTYLNIGTGGFFEDQDNIKTVTSCNPDFWVGHSDSDAKDSIIVEKGLGFVHTKGIWAPIVHKNYCRFNVGDTIVRWRDVEDWEWEEIGEVEPPKIGDPIVVGSVSGPLHLYKVASIYSSKTDWWYPATAFVLEKYYKPNRGTAELNTTDYGKDQSRCIEVQRPLASIITGERRTGSTVQGRRDATIVRRGYPSHKTIFGI